MTRTTAREIAVHLSYETVMNPMKTDELLDSFFNKEYYDTLKTETDLYKEYPDDRQLDYIRRLAAGVAQHSAELDDYIAKYAKNWRFERISRVAAAIMRTAMYEVLYMPEVPYKAAVNEAVELAKKYEDRDVVSFINGVLGGFIAGETGIEK
jgi:N utilization substance protein B